MDKRKITKKLSVNKETLQRLEPGDLRLAGGGDSWMSYCMITCGYGSCMGFCTLNCSDLRCIAGPVDVADG